MAKNILIIMKNKFLCFLLFLIVSGFVNAQSDEKKIIKAKTHLDEAEKMGHYIQTKGDSILYLSNQALKTLQSLNKKNINQELYYELLTKAYNNIGAVYYVYGKTSNALENFQKSIKVGEKIKDNTRLIDTYINFSLIYKKQQDTLNATKLLKKALRLSEIINDKKNISTSLNNLGNLCPASKAKLSLSYYLKSLEIEEDLGNLKEIGIREQNIATAYQNLGELNNAKKWYLKSLETKRKINDNFGLASLYNALSELYLEENNYSEAEKTAKEAYKFAQIANSLDHEILACEKLFLMLNKDNKYKEAITYLEKLNTLKEKKLLLANQKQTDSLQIKFEYDKKLEAIGIKSSLEQQSLNLKLKVERQKQSAFYFFIFLTLSFSLLMYNRFKKTKKQNIIIEEQKKIVEHKNQEITDSINYAKRIQHTLLANDALLRKNLSDYFVLFKPKDIVSGDFYWASEQENDFYIAACDSTGHGVPGAFMSLLNISFLNEAVNEKNILEPNEILNYVRKRLIDNIGQDGGQDGMDGTLIRLNKVSKKITYASAYNSPIVVSEKSIVYLSSNRMAVGKSPYEHKSFDLFTLDYKPGDILYLYTDGFPDQFGGDKGKKFKLKQLQENLLSLHDTTVEKQGPFLEQLFEEWRGKFEQVDDVLVIGIKL
jgi:serine phosphatase RsbU (regulator of sigma subunit)